VDGDSATIWILADTTNDIDESHEFNNDFSTQITEESSSPTEELADLEITYFQYYMSIDGTVEYYVNITNSGPGDAGYFFVDLFADKSTSPSLNDDGDHYVAIDSLAAGATEWLDITREDGCNFCDSWVMVDGYDFIEESDESNNISGPLYVSP
jgi:hypothetical protein